MLEGQASLQSSLEYNRHHRRSPWVAEGRLGGGIKPLINLRDSRYSDRRSAKHLAKIPVHRQRRTYEIC